MQIRLKRVYEPRGDGDGKRILVDRLWPRGLTKAEAAVDLWLKDIAPSTELRRWFHGREGEWAEFRRRYRAELKESREAVETLVTELQSGPATLLYGAKDEKQNHAIVLAEFIRER